MNREIKFRVWDGASMQDPHNTIVTTLSYVCNNSQGFIPMQYTGLKDTNLKDIYEGDIVKSAKYIGGNFVEWEYFTGLVHYEQQACRYWIKRKDIDGKHRYMDLEANEGGDYMINSSLEVIGNIYENPELLK